MSIILTESVPNPLGGCEPLGPIYAGHDARMRPLAGMAAHRAATLAREVPRGGTTPTASRASPSVLSRRFRAELHEIGRFEGLGPDS